MKGHQNRTNISILYIYMLSRICPTMNNTISFHICSLSWWVTPAVCFLPKIPVFAVFCVSINKCILTNFRFHRCPLLLTLVHPILMMNSQFTILFELYFWPYILPFTILIMYMCIVSHNFLHHSTNVSWNERNRVNDLDPQEESLKKDPNLEGCLPISLHGCYLTCWVCFCQWFGSINFY